ncbi:MAG: hypothetical protein ACK5LT_12905 [Lachnospirales bacterium]
MYQIFFDIKTLGDTSVMLPKGITFETTIEEVVEIYGVSTEITNTTSEVVYRYKPASNTYINEEDYIQMYFKDGIVSKFNIHSCTPKISDEDMKNMPTLGLEENNE